MNIIEHVHSSKVCNKMDMCIIQYEMGQVRSPRRNDQ